ncbi:hypothetical protein ACLI4R_17455 [Natrialbaceae archaeon A-chndr2]
MPFELSEDSPLETWIDNSNELNEDNYEWANDEDNVLIRALSTDDGDFWQVHLFDTSTDEPNVVMDHSWEYTETLHHSNTARAVAEEFADSYQDILD